MRPRLLLITPIAPAATGNGLAMRGGVWVEGLARHADLTVAVVPVSDAMADEGALAWARTRADDAWLVPLPSAEAALASWIGSSEGRALASRIEPLGSAARLAAPGLGAEILERAGAVDGIVVQRAALAGLVATCAERAERPRLVLDLDEDDSATLGSIAALERARGRTEAAERTEAEAEAAGRMLRAVLGSFDRVVVSTEVERGRLASTYRCDAQIVPNAVAVEEVAPSPAAGPAVLFVGSLDYAPNEDAAERLVRGVFPALRRRVPAAELHLVGTGRPPAGADQIDGVHLHGRLPDLQTAYERAAAVVVPLRAGGGSRLKLLEAFARRVPVVATPLAAEGLGVRDGEHYAAGSDDEELAACAAAVLTDPKLGAALAEKAYEYARSKHDLDVVAKQIAAMSDEVLGR